MIIDGLPGGGAEKVVLTLSEGLLHQGHSVTLFSLRDVCHYELPEGLNYQVVADHCRQPWRKLNELSRRAKALDDAVRLAEKQQGLFELICSHLHKTDRIVSRSALLSGRNLWFCLHGMLSIAYLGHRHGINRWWKRYKIAQVYRRKNIIAVSAAVADDMRNTLAITPRQWAIINNPFDMTAIRQQANQHCELAGQDYVIHVGRFHPHKRHDRLLTAFAKTTLKIPLVLLGEGDKQAIDGLKMLAQKLNIADQVKFLGFHANPYPYIKHAKLLVLSSDSEGFGNVLIEALLCGTPVVSTDCPGGPGEILRNAGFSRGLSALNPESLSEVINNIYHNPPVIDEINLLRYRLVVACNRYLSLKQ